MARLRVYFSYLTVLGALTALSATRAVAQQPPDFGTLVLQVRPSNAEILIDGVQWPASETSDALKIQLAPGTHKVEIRAAGRQTFVQDVTINAGQSTPLNVSLTQSDRPVVSPPPPPAPTPRPRVPEQQPPPPGPPPPQSPPGSHIKVGPSDDGFMFAPDVRFTEVNGRASTLIGGYGGMVYGKQLLIGAGAYFQVYDAYNRYMNYFGPVVEYRLFPEKTIGLNLHALVGGGVAYGGNNCCYPVYGPYHYGYYTPYNTGFFVFEPEAQVSVRFSPILSLKGAVGYRVTSGYNLDGVSGSVSLQIGK
jgi:hypothetical protein